MSHSRQPRVLLLLTMATIIAFIIVQLLDLSRRYNPPACKPRTPRRRVVLFEQATDVTDHHPDDLMTRSAVFDHVHFVWASTDKKLLFQFRHFAAILGARRFVRPMRIYIHHFSCPVDDQLEWLVEAVDFVHNLEFVFEPTWYWLTSTNRMISDLARRVHTGIILRPNVVVTQLFVETIERVTHGHEWRCLVDNHINIVVVNEFDCTQTEGCLGPSYCDRTLDSNMVAIELHGVPVAYVLSTDSLPVDHLKNDTTMSSTIRLAYYGSLQLIAPRHYREPVIPAIVHFICLGHRKLSFLQRVSIQSTLTHGGMERAYVHGEHHPDGEHWDALKTAFGDRIQFMLALRPNSVYGVELATIQQQRDVLQLELLQRYGGLYVDTSIIVTKSLRKFLHHDAVIGLNLLTPQYIPSMETCFLLTRANGEFINILLQNYRQIGGKIWDANCCQLPMKIYQRFPRTIFVERNIIYQPPQEQSMAEMINHMPDNWRNHYAFLSRELELDEVFPEEIQEAGKLSQPFFDSLNSTFGEMIRFGLYRNTALRTD